MSTQTFVIFDDPPQDGRPRMTAPDDLGGKVLAAWSKGDSIERLCDAEKLLAKLLHSGMTDPDLVDEIEEYFDGFMWESLLDDEGVKGGHGE